MDSTRLIASLQEAIPGVHIESAPAVDLHETIVVSRDDVPAVMRALRDRPDLAFAFLAELTAGSSAKCGTCSASSSPAIPIHGAC
jgi:hypothetical protein